MTTANGAPWDIRLWLYPGADPAADPTDWGLERDISSSVRYPGGDGGQAVGYSGGRGDEATQMDAGAMALTLDNRDGRFSTQNIAGAYYPDLRRNTPVRLGVAGIADTFTRSSVSGLGTADTGHVWTLGTGTAGHWTVDGSTAQATLAANTSETWTSADGGGLDLDVTVTVIPAAVFSGASCGAGALLRRASASDQVIAAAFFETDSSVTIHIYTVVGGVATVDSTTTAGTYSAGQRWRVRAQADGATIRAKAWPEADDEPAAWAVTATDTSTTGTAVGVYTARLTGNLDAGPQLAVDDFTAVVFEFTGTVSSWPVRWDKSGNNCWAPIQAAGVLRRLRQGSAPEISPLYRQLTAENPIAYWPLEDGSAATVFGNAVAGGRPATFRHMTPAQESTLGGSAPVAALSDARGTFTGSATSRLPGSATGFSAMILIKFDSLPVVKTFVAAWRATGRVQYWIFQLDGTTSYVEGRDVDGALVVSDAAVVLVDPTRWVAWQLETEVVGANTTWAFIHHEVGSTTYYAQSGSYASTAPSTAYQVIAGGGGDLAVGTAFAHAWLGPNTLPFVADSFSLVSSGYAGELAADRISRLCTEHGVPCAVEPGDSDPLGAQPSGSFLDQVQAAADADLGILYERGNGLGYRPRTARYSPSVTLALAVADAEIAEPLEPVDDDQRIRNKWTITRDGGTAAVAQDDDSIAAEGLYEDSATLNVYSDDAAADHAGWRLHLSTRPGWRWPGVALNFARTPDLLPQWRTRRYGFRATVDTGLDQVTGADPDVLAEGFSAQLWPHGWTVDLNCVQAGAWDVPQLDDGVRLDTDGSTLDTDVAAADTSLPVATTGATDGSPLWTTDGGDVPFDVDVGGERVTVTAVAGSSSPQTFTVTRGVDGLALDHAAGTDVRLWAPTHLAL